MEPLRSVTPEPWGIRLLAPFFAAATLLLIVVAISLQWPGTPLDAVWHLNPPRRALLMLWRPFLAPAFLLLAVPMAFAAVGCYRRAAWGWWLAVVIFAANGLGDIAQLLAGHLLEGLLGAVVAGLILFCLSRPCVRAAFGRRQMAESPHSAK